MIDEQTKLLEVLAEEFDSHGITVDRDINGLKEINGLNLKGGKSGRAGQSDEKVLAGGLGEAEGRRGG